MRVLSDLGMPAGPAVGAGGATGAPARGGVEEARQREQAGRLFAAILWRTMLKTALSADGSALAGGGFAGGVYRDMLIDTLAERVAAALPAPALFPGQGPVPRRPAPAAPKSPPASGRG